MLAVKLSLMSLLADKTHCHVRIMSDNTTVVCYINDGGGGGSKSVECHRLAKNIWSCAIARNIWLSAAHVPGVRNVSSCIPCTVNSLLEFLHKLYQQNFGYSALNTARSAISNIDEHFHPTRIIHRWVNIF